MATILDGPNKGKQPAKLIWLGKLNSQKLAGHVVLYDEVITPKSEDEELSSRSVQVEIHKLGALLGRFEITDITPDNVRIKEIADKLGVHSFFLAITIVAGYFK